MTVLQLDPRRLAPRVLTPPVSKSDALRALVLAHALERPALAGEVSCRGAELPADVRVAALGLAGLRDGAPRIDCADGGAPFRFLLAQAAVAGGRRVQFVGAPRLGQRPHGALFDALDEALGPAGFRAHRGDPWPIEVTGAGRAEEPVFRVRGDESSQFASALLFAAAALARREGRTWHLELEGGLTSAAYLELSLAWAAHCGVPIGRLGSRLAVGPALPAAEPPPLPSDWSSLGYLLLIAWRTGGAVQGVDAAALHPDREILDHLGAVGLRVSLGDVTRVSGAPRRGLCASAARTPDLIPTLAALACVCPGHSAFTEVSALRGKESDRLAGVVALVEAAGGKARLSGDVLTVVPPRRPRAKLSLSARADHRLAMSAATLAVLTGAPLALEGPECVAKSFPGFWEQLAA